MPIHLSNSNGTQIYHREDDQTYKFSIFGSRNKNVMNFEYVGIEDIARNNRGFFSENTKRKPEYFQEGINQPDIKIDVPVWTLAAQNDDKVTTVVPVHQNNEQQTNQQSIMEQQPVITKPNHSKKFIWPYGGKSVYLTGTFDNWQASIPMTPVNNTTTADINDNVFEVTVDSIDLTKDNTYKFVVDGEWCYDVKKDFVVDSSGNVNNIIYAEN